MDYYYHEFGESFHTSIAGEYVKILTSNTIQTIVSSPWELILLLGYLQWELQRDKRISKVAFWKLVLAFLYQRGVLVLFRGVLYTCMGAILKKWVCLTTCLLLRDSLSYTTIQIINYFLGFICGDLWSLGRVIVLFQSGDIDTNVQILGNYTRQRQVKDINKTSSNEKNKGKAKVKGAKPNSKRSVNNNNNKHPLANSKSMSFLTFIKNHIDLILISGVFTIMKSILEDQLVLLGQWAITKLESSPWLNYYKMTYSLIAFTLLHPFVVSSNRVVIGYRFRSISYLNSPPFLKLSQILRLIINDGLGGSFGGIYLIWLRMLWSALSNYVLGALISQKGGTANSMMPPPL